MSALDDRDKDPNLDEYAYEQCVENPADDGEADQHADNPNPDADGVAPDAVDDPTGVIEPDAD
jgi:hypothetical protein